MIVAGLTFGCSVGQVQGAAPNPGLLRFDAEWWQHANGDEQQGFIYGYQDCRQPLKAAKASIDDYQKAVSVALGTGKSSDPDVVTKAIENAWTTLKSRDTRGGENYSGPHGYLDGEWWGSFPGAWPSNVADADRGYLEGYLQCSSTPVTVKAVHHYQTAMNKHYASGRHDHDKIAVVLQGLMKPPPTSPQSYASPRPSLRRRPCCVWEGRERAAGLSSGLWCRLGEKYAVRCTGFTVTPHPCVLSHRPILILS